MYPQDSVWSVKKMISEDLKQSMELGFNIMHQASISARVQLYVSATEIAFCVCSAGDAMRLWDRLYTYFGLALN